MILLIPCGAAARSGDSDVVASLPKPLEASCWLAKASPDGPGAPCWMPVSFDKDERPVRALLVRERSGNRRRGIAVLADDGQTALIGAGKVAGAGGDDLGWMGAWTVLQPLDPDNRALDGEGSLDGQALALLPADGSPSLAQQGCKGPLLVILHRSESAGDETQRKIAAQVWDLGEPRRRLAGLDALRVLNVQPIKGCLLPGLRDPDEAVRLETAHVLAHSHVTEALSVLAGWLSPPSKEISPFSRSAVAHMVGELGGAAAAGVLERSAEDPDWDVRKAAVEGLQTIGGSQAMAAILNRLEDVDARVRLVAAQHACEASGLRRSHGRERDRRPCPLCRSFHARAPGEAHQALAPPCARQCCCGARPAGRRPSARNPACHGADRSCDHRSAGRLPHSARHGRIGPGAAQSCNGTE